MKIGIKLRCYPDSQLKQLIHQTAGNNRFIYNYFLNLKNTSYQENKTSLSYQDCSALLLYLKNSVFAFQKDNYNPIDFMTISGHDFNLLKRNYFLKVGFSTSIQFALKSLDNAFNNFFILRLFNKKKLSSNILSGTKKFGYLEKSLVLEIQKVQSQLHIFTVGKT